MVEGGSFVKLRPGVAAYGTSIRCNDEGARQLAETLRPLGIELVVVPLSGYSIHIDGHLGMVDVDKALVDTAGLPYWFLERLRELRIEAIPCPAGRGMGDQLALPAPGWVLMAEGYPRAVEVLSRRGIDVVTVPYDEIHKGGGGVHCSTMELVRDPAA